jgi:hypothetical protein
MTHEMGSTALWLMLLLGTYHGINPGMGWLFAVALGMQEQRGSAVGRVLVPIAVGHALSIGTVVVAAAFLGMALPQEAIRFSVAALLFGLGIFSLVRHYHPRWVRMRVDFRDLTLWSFLMASAHGAGLMLLPVLLGSRTVERLTTWQATITHPRPAALSQHFSPPRFIRPPILRSPGSSRGWSIASSASRFFGRPGSISTWYGLQHSWSPACSLC